MKHEALIENIFPVPQNPLLRTYLNNLNTLRGIPEPAVDTITGIERIIQRNNMMAEVLRSPEYLEILAEEKELRGNAKVGGVGCIDGRFDFIHPFGRVMNVWEEPASLIEIREHRDGASTVKSPQFTEALRAAAYDKRDLLEIVFAHTSLTTDHKCGRMMAGDRLGEFKGLPTELETIEAKNLYLINNVQIPAITETFNTFRGQSGQSPLARVAISAMYDTDTMGVIFNFGTNHEFSTTQFVRELKQEIDLLVPRRFSGFGSMKDAFTDPNQFIEFSRNVFGISKNLLRWETFQTRVSDYINTSYSELTSDQKQALLYIMARTIASQYVTGLAYVPPEGPAHAFAEHHEKYMTVSIDGRILGGLDVGEQSFGSSPSDVATAVSHIKTKLSLLDARCVLEEERTPNILFVSKAVDASLWESHEAGKQDATVKRSLGNNGELVVAICEDENIRRLLKEGALIIIPVLIDQDTRRVLTVIDQSIYV